MKPRPLNRSIATIFYAADTGGAPGGSVPATESPTGSEIPTSEPAKSAASVMPVPERPATRVLSAREALGLPESPRKEASKMVKELRAKTDATTIKLPPKKTTKGDTGAAQKPPAPGSEQQGQPPAKPVETVVGEQKPETGKAPETPAAKAPEAKISYKGKEYTATEFTAMMEKAEKDLAERAKQTEADPKGEQKGEKTAKEQKQTTEPSAKDKLKAIIDERVKGIDLEAAGIGLTEDSFDTILAGGKEGVATFLDILKRAVAYGIEQGEGGMKALRNEVSPALEMQTKIAEYQAENTLLGMAADIANHPQGRETMRAVADRIHAEYDRCQRLISAGLANAEEIKWAQEYEASTPEEFSQAIIDNTRKALPPAQPQTTQQVSQQPTPPQTQVEQPKPKTPQPPTGHVGGSPAPQKQNTQRELAQDLLQHTVGATSL